MNAKIDIEKVKEFIGSLKNHNEHSYKIMSEKMVSDFYVNAASCYEETYKSDYLSKYYSRVFEDISKIEGEATIEQYFDNKIESVTNMLLGQSMGFTSNPVSNINAVLATECLQKILDNLKRCTRIK